MERTKSESENYWQDIEDPEIKAFLLSFYDPVIIQKIYEEERRQALSIHKALYDIVFTI